MKNKKKFLLGLSVLVGVTFACSAPFQVQPTQPGPSPIDETLTAVFKVFYTSTAIALQVSSATLPPSTTPSPTFTLQPSNTTVPPTQIPSDTKTPKPTKTSAPPTETPEPNARKGTSVGVSFLNQPPVLDGVWDEWTTKAYPATNLVFGAGQWSGKNDLGASFRIGWDYRYLYLAVKVGDDTYVQNDSGANIYKGDSIEILLDTDVQGDFESGQLNSDDFQLGISPGSPDPGNHPEAYLWFPRNVAGPRSKVRIGVMGGTNLYRVEAAVPWSLYGITPEPGMHLGFVLRVNDDDDPDKDVQQSVVANVPGSSLADPTMWGDLVLEK